MLISALFRTLSATVSGCFFDGDDIIFAGSIQLHACGESGRFWWSRGEGERILEERDLRPKVDWTSACLPGTGRLSTAVNERGTGEVQSSWFIDGYRGVYHAKTLELAAV